MVHGSLMRVKEDDSSVNHSIQGTSECGYRVLLCRSFPQFLLSDPTTRCLYYLKVHWMLFISIYNCHFIMLGWKWGVAMGSKEINSIDQQTAFLIIEDEGGENLFWQNNRFDF